MKKSFKPVMLLLLAATIMFTSCKKESEQNPSGGHDKEVVLSDSDGKSIEGLCKEYFSEHEEEKQYEEKVLAVARDFIARQKNTDEFAKKKPCRIQPVYAYGVDGVAYYEIWFTEDDATVKGWALISATEKDYPLVNFSYGIPYSSRLLKDADKGSKVYRFGVSYYVLENNGQKVADYGKMPEYVVNPNADKGFGGSSEDGDILRKGADLREGIDYVLISDYESLKREFPKYYFSENRGSTARKMRSSISDNTNARVNADWIYRWVGGQQCYYTQIPANTGFNTFDCWSGCNNNAWANIYGWWDRNKGKANLIPTTSTGETSPIYRNTTARQNSIDPVQMYLRSVSGTYCGDGTGWTSWANTYKGYQYGINAGYACYYQYYWCAFSGCNSTLANIATDGIANKYTPVYIGANSHAYVGYGWAQWSDDTKRTWVYCYPGWSENNNDDVWISWYDFNAAVKFSID